jgi:hypothetical protein
MFIDPKQKEVAMAVQNVPIERIAFRGNLRRSMQKTIAGGNSLLNWISSHQNATIQPLTVAQYNQLLQLLGVLSEQLKRKTFV